MTGSCLAFTPDTESHYGITCTRKDIEWDFIRKSATHLMDFGFLSIKGQASIVFPYILSNSSLFYSVLCGDLWEHSSGCAHQAHWRRKRNCKRRGNRHVERKREKRGVMRVTRATKDEGREAAMERKRDKKLAFYSGSIFQLNLCFRGFFFLSFLSLSW